MSEIATDYMEGRLPFMERVKARHHLVLCGACRRYYGQLRRTIALLATGKRKEPPKAVEDRLVAAAKVDPPID